MELKYITRNNLNFKLKDGSYTVVKEEYCLNNTNLIVIYSNRLEKTVLFEIV